KENAVQSPLKSYWSLHLEHQQCLPWDFHKHLEFISYPLISSCKGDLVGQRTLVKKWTSFQKTHLDCPVPQTRLPFLIQDVFLFCPGNWNTRVFHGVFTPEA
ncbi:semaphorin-4E-like isoform X1, partial [Clarias magur]